MATDDADTYGQQPKMSDLFNFLVRASPWCSWPLIVCLFFPCFPWSPWQTHKTHSAHLCREGAVALPGRSSDSGAWVLAVARHPALRNDFPAMASVFVLRLFPNTAARQFRSHTGFPIPVTDPLTGSDHYMWYLTKDLITIYMKCPGNKPR